MMLQNCAESVQSQNDDQSRWTVGYGGQNEALDPEYKKVYKFLGCKQGDKTVVKRVIKRIKNEVKKRTEKI